MSWLNRQETDTTLITYLNDLDASMQEDMPTQCAWCLQERGEPMGEGSHGICTRHANSMMKVSRERKRR